MRMSEHRARTVTFWVLGAGYVAIIAAVVAVFTSPALRPPSAVDTDRPSTRSESLQGSDPGMALATVEPREAGGPSVEGNLPASPVPSTSASWRADEIEDLIRPYQQANAGQADDVRYLTERLLKVERELEICRAEVEVCNGDLASAYGEFLHSDLSAGFNAEELGLISHALHSIPVQLTAEEAEWIARHDRELNPDGGDFWANLVAYLGADRIAREVNGHPDRVAAIRAALYDDKVRELFGDRLDP